jgi:CRISPR-associated protein Csm1
MNRQHELEKVILGCLIHHLDDLIERSWNNEIPDLVKNVMDRVKSYFDMEDLQPLIAHASKLAHGGDDIGMKPGEHVPLCSIFSSVSLSGKLPSRVGYFIPQVLAKEPIYPCIAERENLPVIGPDNYQPLCDELFGAIDKLLDRELFSANAVALLMQKYCSFIPHVQVGKDETGVDLPDVSLFDHLRLATAFAACLHVQGKASGGEYLLVLGDLSGIQKFVYSISSRGALKTLRARSFFLELLTLHIVQRMIETFNLSHFNVLYATGGLFSVLIPKIDGVESKLDQIRRGINSYLANMHDSRVYLAMEYTDPSNPFQDVDFLESDENRFGEKERETHKKVNDAKRQRFRAVLDESLEQYMMPFMPSHDGLEITSVTESVRNCARSCGSPDFTPAALKVKIKDRLYQTEHIVHGCRECLKDTKSGECGVCHQESALLLPLPEPGRSEDTAPKEPVYACLFCNMLYHLGEHLPASQTAVIVRKKSPPRYEESKAYVFIEDCYYYVKSRPDASDIGNDKYIWSIDEIDPFELIETCGSSMMDHAWTFLMARYQRYEIINGQPRPLDFKNLADKSVGSSKIGVLKMDVDSLGDIFTRGLKREHDEMIGISRRISLSRQMEMFFKFHMDTICTGTNGRNVAVVYSGGDDLFIVGSWNDVVKLAFDIHKDFKAYTAQNPDVDLSAGLILTSESYPLYRMADLAGNALKKAKEHEEDGFKKASVSLFYTPQKAGALKWERRSGVNWAAGVDVLDMVGMFSKLKLPDDGDGKVWKLGVSRSFIQDLFRIVDVYRESGKLYIPRLVYILARARLAPEAQPYWGQLRDKLMRLDTMEYLYYALTWVELLCREKR